MFLRRCFCLLAAAAALPAAAEPLALTLDEAFSRALATDESIAIAYAEARRSALEPASALTRLLPTLNGTASSNRSDRTGVNRGFTSQLGNVAGGALTTNQASLSLVLPFVDFTVFPAYRRGKIVSEAARLDYRAAIRQTLFSVAAAYFDVLSQERIVEVSRETLRLAQENLEVARTRAAAGAVTRTDVLRATASAEESRRALIQAENDLVTRRNVLANFLDLSPAEREFVLRTPPPGEARTDSGGLEGLLATAFARREDLRARELAILRDEEARREVRAQYAPTLGGQASASSTAASGGLDRSDWQAALTVRVPFLDAGTRTLDLRRAGIQIDRTRQEFERFRETVQQEVTDAYVQVQALRETVAALEAQVEAERQAYEDTRTQYRSGTARSLDVLDALRALNNARTDLAVQAFGYEVALRRLDQVTGVLEEERVNRALP
jgi:outer membrane protein TolC